jgi:ferredoxin
VPLILPLRSQQRVSRVKLPEKIDARKSFETKALNKPMSSTTPIKMGNRLTNCFKINTEKCNYPKCTYCADNCPNDAIDLSASPPLFDRDCDLCFLCEQTCPRGAIEYDYEPLENPHKPLNISVLQNSVNAFEAKGLFRRLVPDGKIGWDTSFRTIKKPPRFKIDY